MAIKVRNAGTLRTITGIKVKQGGVLRTVRAAYAYEDGSLRLIWANNLSVTASPSLLDGRGSSGGATSSPTSAVPDGGFAPYTYSWSLVSSEGTPSAATSPSSATTQFTKADLPVNVAQTDVWRVTVTDSVGQTATDDVTVVFFQLFFSY